MSRFNYTRFLNYYTDASNVEIDNNPPITNYFHGGVQKTKTPGPTYITIQGKKYYINVLPSNNRTPDKIIFSDPVDIGGTLYDNHYHFGISNNFTNQNVAYRKKQVFPVIFFHKTVQEPDKKETEHTRCYFLTDQNIHDVTKFSDIPCVQNSTSKMGIQFPLTGPDIEVIREIVRRPFYGVLLNGGKQRRCRTMYKRARKARRHTIKRHRRL